MEKISFKIIGKRQVIQHNPASMARSDNMAAGRKKIPTPAEEAEAGCYRLPSGQLYLKSEAFAGSLRNATKTFKINKMAARTVFSAGVFMLDEHCGLIHPESGEPISGYEIFTCRAVVQRQGILRSRPRIFPWACILNVEYDPEILTPAVILQFLNRAGQYVGVGDQRPGAPQTPGQYGTYSAELVDAEAAAEAAETKNQKRRSRSGALVKA